MRSSPNLLRRLFSPQALLIVAALVVWAWWSAPALWALAGSYLLAWLLLDRLGRGARWTPDAPKSARLAVIALLAVAAVPVVDLVRDRYAVADTEGWIGLGAHLTDRLRLERAPAVFPPTVFADHPQTLYIFAPEADVAGLRLAPDLPTLEGTNLGHGLFRVAFDPRTDTVPATQRASLDAAIMVDGRAHPRRLGWVRPLAHPRWFASAPERGLAATLSEETDEAFVIDRQGLRHRIAVADGPTDAAFLADGRLAVCHRYTPELWLLDPLTGEVLERIETDRFQTRIAVSPDGTHLAIAIAGTDPHIVLLDPTGADPKRETIPLGHAADWLAFGPRPDLLVIADRHHRSLRRLERLDDASDRPWRATGHLPLGRPVVTLARAPDGRELLVATTDFRGDGEPHRGNHFVQDQLITVDPETLEVVARRLTDRRTPSQDEPGAVTSGASPMGIVVRGDGTALVAFAGSEEVWMLPRGVSSPQRVVDGYDLDLVSAHGVADLGAGFWAASSPAGGALAIYDAAGKMVEFIGITPPDDELADAPAESLDRLALTLRSGERAFYEATRSGISCQSCHLHAATDGSAHEIGQNPLLPTLTVRGTTGTAPYLRDGSFPRVRDLDTHLASDLYRGYLRYEPDRGQALETYVASLPREVNPQAFEARDLDRERAGLDAFVRARCDLCHTPPAFTNLSQHPVRALFPDYGAEQAPGSQIDTPSLLGSHGRDHFLQDGRASDIAEVLDTHNQAQRHGDAMALTNAERADLVHFLLSL